MQLQAQPYRHSLCIVWMLAVGCCAAASAQEDAAILHVVHRQRPRVFLPEQHHIDARAPEQFPIDGLVPTPAPPTVKDEAETDPSERPLSLDEAIRIALANSEVVRVLSGVTASSTGQTIYSVAIANTAIDEQRARFDPTLSSEHRFNRFEPPVAVLDPMEPAGARIFGTRTEDYDHTSGISKTTMTGGTAAFNVNTNPARFQADIVPLNPQTRQSLDLSYTQPLYRGGGIHANRAPIVIARLDAERSFFQYKESMQQLVRSVVAAYWALVFARTDECARQKQVERAEFDYKQALGELKADRFSRADVAQPRVSLGNFRTALTAAQNNVLLREAALRNVMGLPPSDGLRLVPVTAPANQPVEFDWNELVALAETHRPDLIQAKLILEADHQQLLVNKNQAHPNIDALMLYRWNGLDGRTPTGDTLTTQGGQFTDWTLGVTFSVPLSLRQERAALRRQELIIAQDEAFLRQGLHNMTHNLTASLRNLAQFQEQYQELREIRGDAELNVRAFSARWNDAGGLGGILYLQVLQANTDWGNTISAEAQALINYNIELANLELETGTILEAHGIVFFEERHCNVGPLGRLGKPKAYPVAMPPSPNANRYGSSDRAAEHFFNLEDPAPPRGEDSEEIPTPEPAPLRDANLRVRLPR